MGEVGVGRYQLMHKKLAESWRCLKCVLTTSCKCCAGNNSKAWRQPAYLTMEGAHGLLDQATQLLTETAQAKPQRRC